METFTFFCLIFILYISASTAIIVGLFFNNKFNIKYSVILPQKNFKLKNGCPFIKQKTQKYLSGSYFYITMHILVFGFFILIGVLVGKNLGYIIPFGLFFILISSLIFLSLKTYGHNIKFLGYCTYEQAFENIGQYYKILNIDNQDISINLIVYKNNHLFHRFTNLIINKNKSFAQKINNATNKQEIINLFNAYLKRGSYFNELIAKNYPTYRFQNSKNNYQDQEQDQELNKIIGKNFFIGLHNNQNFKKILNSS